jgi:alanyl-tRNA synthetase
VSEAEAATLPLRKEPAKSGTLRLVDVTDFDLSACGGTHVPQTGFIGAIVITGWERFKGATRLSFACGGRALRSHAALRDVVVAATRSLSVLPTEISGAIERLQTDVKASGRELKRLQEELAGYQAAAFRARAETIGPFRVVLQTQARADAQALKTLVAAIIREPGLVVIFTGEGTPTPVVAARSADVAFDAGAWIKRATSELGGRGGGRPELAQAGIEAPADRISDFARRTLGAP